MARINSTNKKLINLLSIIFTLCLFTGCSHYKSSWSCKNPEGIGCSSIGYADIIARKSIILNDDANQIAENPQKKLLINERYSDFKKQNMKEVNLD